MCKNILSVLIYCIHTRLCVHACRKISCQALSGKSDYRQNALIIFRLYILAISKMELYKYRIETVVIGYYEPYKSTKYRDPYNTLINEAHMAYIRIGGFNMWMTPQAQLGAGPPHVLGVDHPFS